MTRTPQPPQKMMDLYDFSLVGEALDPVPPNEILVFLIKVLVFLINFILFLAKRNNFMGLKA